MPRGQIQCREGRVTQSFDLPLLPSGPGGVRRTAAAQFPAMNCSTAGHELAWVSSREGWEFVPCLWTDCNLLRSRGSPSI